MYSEVVIIGILIVAAAFFVILYPYASGLLTPNWYLNIGQSLISVYHS